MNSSAVLRFGFSRKALATKGVVVGALDSSSLTNIAVASMWLSGLYTEENELVLGSEFAGGSHTIAKPLIVIDPMV